MALQVGSKFGVYRISAHIGSGGMGDVWRAHDERLERDVAIKTLRGDFAHDPERLSRLQHEAKLLAALNHPNIASIYDFEEFAQTYCLILELVEGQTLESRINGRGVPLRETINIALQIADALAASHDRSIIHRD